MIILHIRYWVSLDLIHKHERPSVSGLSSAQVPSEGRLASGWRYRCWVRHICSDASGECEVICCRTVVMATTLVQRYWPQLSSEQMLQWCCEASPDLGLDVRFMYLNCIWITQFYHKIINLMWCFFCKSSVNETSQIYVITNKLNVF